VFRQLMSQGSGNREAFRVPESEMVFNLFARPIIIAAYVYKDLSITHMMGKREVNYSKNRREDRLRY